MIIIWGWKGREIEKRSGRFYCPECDAEQNYKLMRVSTYFTLYFLPLFETQHHGDYVECHRCSGRFRPEVLDYRPPTQLERLAHAVRHDLESGTPFEIVTRKLLNADMEPEGVDKLLTILGRGTQISCVACRLSFLPNIEQCSACGGRLSLNQTLIESAA